MPRGEITNPEGPLSSAITPETPELVREAVIGWRRHLHQHPELSFHERNTSPFVAGTLASFGHLEITRPTATSVAARLIAKDPGPVLAIRADMDALPIHEASSHDFVSRNSGVMHACGHDGHTSILLGAARILVSRRDELRGEVRFLFQHAEELYPGGASEMVNAGVLDGVDMAIGAPLARAVVRAGGREGGAVHGKAEHLPRHR